MPLANDLERLKNSMQFIDTSPATFYSCLYGPTGCGKTVLAAIILKTIVPEDKGVLYIDTSNGWVSIKNVPGLQERIAYQRFTSIEDLRLIIGFVKNKIDVYAHVGGIVIDEASSIYRLELNRLYEQRSRAGGTDSLVPEWPDYNAAQSRMRAALSELMDIPGVHVVLLAHVKEKRITKDLSFTFPSFSPDFAAQVKEPLHLVGYVQAEILKSPDSTKPPEYKRTVQVHPSVRYDAKTRLPISQFKVPAQELPGIVKRWLDAGGKQVRNDSTPRKDDTAEDELQPKISLEDMIERIDELQNQDDDFEPINNEPINNEPINNEG